MGLEPCWPTGAHGIGCRWCRFSSFDLLHPAAPPCFSPVHHKSVAAPIAYEQPAYYKSRDAFVTHIPTLLVVWLPIWITTVILLVLGLGTVEQLVTLFGIRDASASPEHHYALSFFWFYWGNLAAFVFSVLGGFAVPSMYYATGETVAIIDAFKALSRRPWRYLIAGILFVIAVLVGFTFCIMPGIVVLLVAPVYVGKIFTTELSILAAFGSSFQAVYCSENSFTFVAIEIVVGLVVIAVSVFSCGLGLLFAPSIASFYVQNAAYRQGVLT